MKKILFCSGIMSLATLLTNCSSDDNGADCSQEVYGLNRVCNPTCVYSVSYGPNEDNLTTIVTNQATYNYYTSIVEDDNELDCWEGEK
jgi:hypothetical protein